MDAAAGQQRSDWTVHGCLQNLRNEREYEIHGELVNRERLLNLLTRNKKLARNLKEFHINYKVTSCYSQCKTLYLKVIL